MWLDKNKVYWFPMRVTYGRQLKVAKELEAMGIDYYLPMMHFPKRKGRSVREVTRPAVSNLIFIRDTLSNITHIKNGLGYVSTLRYMVWKPSHPADAPNEIIVVPDAQMDNFIRLCDAAYDHITFLDVTELRGHVHAHVLITNGPFKGIEGVIKRVHGSKHVIVELDGVGGACIDFVPKAFIFNLDKRDMAASEAQKNNGGNG
jgi:hypothetical protein